MGTRTPTRGRALGRGRDGIRAHSTPEVVPFLIYAFSGGTVPLPLTSLQNWLGLLEEAALVTGGFFYLLLSSGWSPGEAVGPGSSLHSAYLMATAMTFAGITACQVGTAFAARTSP